VARLVLKPCAKFDDDAFTHVRVILVNGHDAFLVKLGEAT
jgi:hypothetical protein